MQVMAGLQASSSARPAAAALSQTPQAGPSTATDAHTPEWQRQPVRAHPQSPAETAALPTTDEALGNASGHCPMLRIIKNTEDSSCDAHQTQLHNVSVAMEIDAGLQSSQGQERPVGASHNRALGSIQLAGQLQGNTGVWAVGDGPSGAVKALGLCKQPGLASHDAPSAVNSFVHEAIGTGVAPEAAGCCSEVMYPVGVTTYTEACFFFSIAWHGGFCIERILATLLLVLWQCYHGVGTVMIVTMVLLL